MGKGTIISGGTDGLYSVKLNLDRAKIMAMITRLDSEISVIDLKLTALETAITAKRSEINSLNINIAYYASLSNIYKDELIAASKSMSEKVNELATLLQQRNVFILQKKALQLRIVYLSQHTPTDPTISAWCADLSEDLTGEIGTIEVPGERGIVLIHPGYSNAAEYAAARDGKLFPAISQTPEQCCYNLAMLPGWQKWMPTYRFGIIDTLDQVHNLCDVTLEAATSSAQDLNINSVETLTGVPVEYMTCNAGAFAVGDSVLIQCTNTITPATGSSKRSISTTYKVIGFKDHPKSCGYRYVIISITVPVVDHLGKGGQTSVIVWDSDIAAPAVIPGVTFPCLSNDADYLTWLSTVSVASGDSIMTTPETNLAIAWMNGTGVASMLQLRPIQG